MGLLSPYGTAVVGLPHLSGMSDQACMPGAPDLLWLLIRDGRMLLGALSDREAAQELASIMRSADPAALPPDVIAYRPQRVVDALERDIEVLLELLVWASNWLPDEAKEQGARDAIRAAMEVRDRFHAVKGGGDAAAG